MKKRQSSPLTWFEIPAADLEAAKVVCEAARNTAPDRGDRAQMRATVSRGGADVPGHRCGRGGFDARGHGLATTEPALA